MRTHAPALLGALLLASCGGRSLPAATVHVQPGAGADDSAIAQVVDAFYAAEMDPEAMQPEIERLLAAHPRSAVVHEMAAHLAELREDFVDHTLSLPVGAVEAAGSGDLLTRTGRDVDQLGWSVRMAAPMRAVSTSPISPRSPIWW